jgi:hypothetical protein
MLNNFVKYIIIVKFFKRLLSFKFFLKKAIFYCLANNLIIVNVLRLSVKLYIIKLKLFAFIGIMFNLIYFYLVF